jgi:anaerobic selenocysteine-containing dehydrogenase
MGKIPFVVSFSPYMDETTQNSDLILPDHTYLEKWQSDSNYTFQGFPVVGIGKPVVEPLYNTRNTGDLIIEIAKSIGKPLAKAFPWKDSKEALFDTMKKVYEMNKGDLFVPELEEALLRELARRGFRAPAYKNFEEFSEGMQEKGGWWDPVYSHEEWERVFRTPSKKFEFYSQALKYHLEKRGTSGGNNLQALKASGIEAKGDQFFLPHWESKMNASPDSEKDYPFHLKIFQPLIFAGSIHANRPFLQDISSFYAQQKWSSWVEINTETAEKLHIKENDWVWVESPSGKLKFRARLTPGAMPQVVNIPMGLGHKGFGRWAKGIGENPDLLMIYRPEPFTGEPLMHKTRVNVYKA